MSTEALQLQVWILGGTTSLLLVAILALLKANMADIKKMLEDHEERIRINESFRERSEERAKAADTQVRVLYDGSNYFYANVTSYNSGTGALVLSSFPDAVGSGSYSSWTLTRYTHELGATIVERSFDYATSYTILAPLDEVNYDYPVGAINRDGISSTDI